MARSTTLGRCRLCGREYAKGVMSRHLRACRRKNPGHVPGGDTVEQEVVHLAVEGRYNSNYWMHIEVPVDRTLSDVDWFLRRIWLDCCDHLSCFWIEGNEYERSSAVGLDQLDPGLTFYHEYDFGSTTYLKLRVVERRSVGVRAAKSALISDNVLILARNHPPCILCDCCGEPAVRICGNCLWADRGYLCEQCSVEHECGVETLLPVTNSPRVGVCGYCGADDDDEVGEARG